MSYGDNKPATTFGPFVYKLRTPGQYNDAESGLFHNGMRDFDPASGRYIESDPVGLIGGLNTYAYAVGNPVSQIDSSGLDPTSGAAGMAGLTTAQFQALSQLLSNPDAVQLFEMSGLNPVMAAANEEFRDSNRKLVAGALDGYGVITLVTPAGRALIAVAEGICEVDASTGIKAFFLSLAAYQEHCAGEDLAPIADRLDEIQALQDLLPGGELDPVFLPPPLPPLIGGS